MAGTLSPDLVLICAELHALECELDTAHADSDECQMIADGLSAMLRTYEGPLAGDARGTFAALTARRSRLPAPGGHALDSHSLGSHALGSHSLDPDLVLICAELHALECELEDAAEGLSEIPAIIAGLRDKLRDYSGPLCVNAANTLTALISGYAEWNS